MKNIKIRPRLLISFMMMVLLMVIAGGYGIFAIKRASDDTQLLNARATSAILSGNLEANLISQRGTQRDTALAAPSVWDVPSIFEDNVKQLALADAEFNTLAAQLEDLLVTEDSKKLLSETVLHYEEFQAGCANLISVLSNDASTPEQVVAALDASTPPYINAISSIQTLSTFFDQMTDDQAVAATAHAAFTANVMLIGIILAAIIAVVLSLYISRIISAPINIMMGLLKQAGETGKLMFTDEELRRAKEVMVFKDEISQSVAAFVQLMENLIDCGKTLEAVANRDLAVNVKLLSDRDTMGVALQMMVENLNAMFEEIRTSSSQVLVGADQVSHAAQALATGSSQQAASIEAFSASLSELQKKTSSNANKAVKAQEANNQTAGRLEDSILSMRELLEAMEAIDVSSSSIANVIKVIDDIAFQTNILALNAAVEAARAGQYGNGFAVVADEVRNLASKSAEAAKETAALIEESSKRVKEGNQIVARTDTDLKAAVENARESTKLIEHVTTESNAQAKSFLEINQNIEQISIVVQANSATAEQSAAAAQEMSAQATILDEIVARFHLSEAAKVVLLSPVQAKSLPKSNDFSIAVGKY